MFFRGVPPTCPRCNKVYSRKPRGFFGRIFCNAAYHCGTCNRTLYYYRSIFSVFAWHAFCPRCNNYDLSRLRKMDHIDPMSRNPVRFVLFLLRFPLYYCTYCRLQFADWRSRHPDFRKARAKRAAAS